VGAWFWPSRTSLAALAAFDHFLAHFGQAGEAFAYAQTKFKIDRLERRLQEFREEILEFCRQKQATVLAGSGVRVAAKFEEKTRFPHKGDPLRAPLEELVRRAGRWDEASDLSLSQLVKVLEEETWPPELLEQLRQFASTEESATMRVTPAKPPETSE